MLSRQTNGKIHPYDTIVHLLSDQERKYGVVVGKTFGGLPKAYQSTWGKIKCDNLVNDYNWCKKEKDKYGIIPHKSWGKLTSKAIQATWESKNCNSVLQQYDDSADHYSPICTVDEKDNERAPYEFMGAIAPYFSIGLELKVSKHEGADFSKYNQFVLNIFVVILMFLIF